MRRLRLEEEAEAGWCPFPEAEEVVMACLFREEAPEAEEEAEDKESRGGRAWTFFFVFAGAGSEGRLAKNAEWQSKADIQTDWMSFLRGDE